MIADERIERLEAELKQERKRRRGILGTVTNYVSECGVRSVICIIGMVWGKGLGSGRDCWQIIL